MNIAPFIAYHANTRSRSYGKSYDPDKGDIIMLSIMLGVLILLFATIETVAIDEMTVVSTTENTLPKFDEYFVTLDDGNTYRVSFQTYSSLTAGDEVEVSSVIKHTWIEDLDGLLLMGDFVRPE